MIESLPLLAWPRAANPVLTILIYHQVMPVPDPLRPGEACAASFDRQMAFLARNFSVLPLVDAVAALGDGTLPRRACCVTFDDGYADNLTVAEPILARHHLPATVFVATAYLDGGRMFNDSVIELVRRVPDAVLDLGALGLGVHPLATMQDRVRAIDALLAQLKYTEPPKRQALVTRMIEMAGCAGLPDDLMLTSRQMRELSDRGVEIGGHTDAHAVLTTLSVDAARDEIAKGKSRIEAVLGKPVRTFAYPNGRPVRDYDAAHVAVVREFGFAAAVTTAGGVSGRDSDIHQLPRFAPWGRSTTLLAARLARNARQGKPDAICVAA